MKTNPWYLCKIFPTVACLSFVLLNKGLAQQVTRVGSQSFVKVNNVWYQFEDTYKFRVNADVITVKFKSGVSAEEMVNFHKQWGSGVLRENRLGFIDIKISSDKDVIDVVKAYLNSGIVDVAEANTFGVWHGSPNV